MPLSARMRELREDFYASAWEDMLCFVIVLNVASTPPIHHAVLITQERKTYEVIKSVC